MSPQDFAQKLFTQLNGTQPHGVPQVFIAIISVIVTQCKVLPDEYSETRKNLVKYSQLN